MSSLDIASFVEGVLSEPMVERRRRRSIYGAQKDAFDRQDYDDPFSRMFSTKVGSESANIVGNESRTLSILTDLATEAIVGTDGGRSVDHMDVPNFSPDTNALVVQRAGDAHDRPPAVLLLDPHLPGDFQPAPLDWEPDYIASRNVGMAAIERLAMTDTQPSLTPERRAVAHALLHSGPEALVDVLWIVRPEVIVARHPEMELVGCPSPALEVECTPAGKPAELSSVGMFCRDGDDVVGVTACHHGTGPVGTPVTLGGLPTEVKLADPIQDIVFVPLPAGYAMPNFARGLKGPRGDKAPAQGDPAQFEGRTSGHKTTVVSSHSPGLLWLDPLSQNKIQTPAAVNKGDSGSALVSDDDHVLGFAFRRTKYGEPLEFAEWIWAANAMAALGLTAL